MKRITKQEEPTTFSEWKQKANKNWQPSYDNLQNPEKQNLHQALIAEQGEVCCYCGRNILRSDSHIEHFRPQKLRNDLQLDYANLHAYCNVKQNQDEFLHCGHAKRDQFCEDKAISPQEANCEQHFIYSRGDGQIFPTNKDDEKAQYMLKILNLNVAFLKNRREEALKRVFDNEFVCSASADELVNLAKMYRLPDEAGRLKDFGHVISRYAEQVLASFDFNLV